MSKKNRVAASGGSTAVLEALPESTIESATEAPESAHDLANEQTVEEFSREAMLAKMAELDPGIDYSEFEDDELRQELAAAMEPPYDPDADKAAEATGDGLAHEAAAVGRSAESTEDLRARLLRVEADLKTAREAKATRKVASGSKPRPNVKYTLLNQAPGWTQTPQVIQLQQILFAPEVLEKYKQENGSVVISEPDLFSLVEEGAKKGILRTRQNPIRICQYYRHQLIAHDVLRMS